MLVLSDAQEIRRACEMRPIYSNNTKREGRGFNSAYAVFTDGVALRMACGVCEVKHKISRIKLCERASGFLLFKTNQAPTTS
jgi:hypothetical protein